MPTLDFAQSNTAPTSIALPSMTGVNDSPSGVALADNNQTAVSPGSISLPTQTPTSDAPSGAAGAGNWTQSNDSPEGITLASSVPSNVEPGSIASTDQPFGELSTVPPVLINPIPGSPSSLPTMPSIYLPAFIELTGAGQSLSTLNANLADATAGKMLDGTVGGEKKSYQVRNGTDAQALPGIVRPFNFDPETNPVVFVQL